MAVTSRLALASLTALAFAQAAQAQEPRPTIIVPDTGPLGLGTQVAQAGNLRTIDGGTRAGQNLFHSFSRFDLGRGDIAQWVRGAGDGASILNVVNRVTGGDPSDIHGRIDSTALPNADFWFINPAGIVFGAGAQVNVPAAAYFSTAHELRFADGPAFTMATPSGSTFSVASPSAFGFVGARGDIAAQGIGQDFLQRRGDLSLSARNVTLDRATPAAAALSLTAVGVAPSSVPIGQVPAGVAGDGAIRLSNGTDLSYRDGGLVITARTIEMSGNSLVRGTGDARLDAIDIAIAESRLQAGFIFLSGARQINLDTSFASTELRPSVAQAGESGTGNIVIRTPSLMVNDTTLTASTFSAQSAGSIDIQANNVVLQGSRIESIAEPNAAGDAGRVAISADTLTIADGIITSDTRGSGSGGSVRLEAGTLSMRGARVSSQTFGTGAGGEVVLRAGALRLEDDARILSNAQLGSTGAGGSIDVRADTILVAGASKIVSETFGAGPAGSVSIGAGALFVERASLISSATHSAARGGSIDIAARSMTVSGSFISADSLSSAPFNEGVPGPGGAAGDLTIVAERLLIRSETTDGVLIPSIVSSSTVTDADAGNVSLTVAELTISGSEVESETRGDGDAGRVAIAAGSLTLLDKASISTSTRPVPSCLGCDETPSGNAGLVMVSVAGELDISGGSAVLSSTESLGNAGEIRLSAGRLTLQGGRVSTSTAALSAGGSGTVKIRAGELVIRGRGSIETVSRNAQPAGVIEIDAGQVTLLGAMSRIASSNENRAGGDAGSVALRADTVTLAGGAEITTSARTGAAGDIRIELPTDGFLILDSLAAPSLITTSSGPGTGGRIDIADAFAIISNGGAILALGERGGANVGIRTRYFISSSDRTNRVAVDGSFLLEAAAYDVSSGTVTRDLSVLDASGVLRGQCASARATGAVSQLVVRPVGPYGRAAPPPPPPSRGPDTLAGLADPATSCS